MEKEAFNKDKRFTLQQCGLGLQKNNGLVMRMASKRVKREKGQDWIFLNGETERIK